MGKGQVRRRRRGDAADAHVRALQDLLFRVRDKIEERGWSHARVYCLARRIGLSEFAAQELERFAIEDDAVLKKDNETWERIKVAVSANKMTTDQAEKELISRGLVKAFDPAKFDSEKEAVWSLTMTLAWIVWRDIEHVRQWWDAARAEMREWSGGCRVPIGPATVLNLKVFAEIEKKNERSERSAVEAFHELRSAAMAGEITGHGVPIRGGERGPIPAHAWHDLTMDDCKPLGRREIVVLGRKEALGDGWRDLTFVAADVRKLWRSSGAPRIAKGGHQVTPASAATIVPAA